MILAYEYKQFRGIIPKDVQFATLIFIIHMSRKTIFNNSGGLFMALCILLNLYIIYKNKELIAEAIRGTKAIIYYCVFAGFSFLWAIKADFGTIIGKDIEILVSFLAIAVTLYKIKDLITCYYYVVVLVSLSTLMGLTRGLLIGAMHTNVYSIPAFVGFILAFNLWYNYKMSDMRSYMILNLVALIVATSSASYIAAIIAISIYLSAFRKGLKISNVILMTLGLFLLYNLFSEFVYSIVFYGKSQKLIETGTGRDYIWKVFINAWKDSPWLGWGYSIAERSMEQFKGGRAGYMSAHNGYLSLLINTGVIGFAIYSPIFIRTFLNGYQAGRKWADPMAPIALFSSFVGVLVNNYTYPILGSDWNYGFVGIIALVILINTLDSKTVEENKDTLEIEEVNGDYQDTSLSS